jgi:hypothetical protein
MFMWDFEEFDKTKSAMVRKQLEGVRTKDRFNDYAKVPMSERLEIASRVYSVLSLDDAFWCRFHRILGYHYSLEKKSVKADESRKNALGIAQKMLNDKSGSSPIKEVWVISGAMKHFLKDDDGAIRDLSQALKIKYENKDLDEEKNKNGERNLNALINEYVERIKSATPPRDSAQ